MTELATGRVRPIGGPEAGTIGTAELVVQQSDCASALDVGNAPDEKFPAVFATTRMIALMEMAGARVLKPLLQEGEMSVGVTVDMIHSAATPIGAKVTATANYRGRDGNSSSSMSSRTIPAARSAAARTSAPSFRANG